MACETHSTGKLLPAWLGATALALSLATAAVAASGEASGSRLPPYPGASSQQFTGTLQANQVPLDAVVLSTPDDMEKVLTFYRKQVKNLKEKMVEKHLNSSLAYVGYYDEPAGLMRLATVMKLADSGTLIILSAMDPRPLLVQAAVPDYVPRPATARDTVTTGGNDGTGSYLTVSYLLEDVTPTRARQLVLQEAARLGWKVEQRGISPREGLLTLSRGQRVCTVQFVKMDTNQRSPIRVSLVIFETKGKSKEKTP